MIHLKMSCPACEGHVQFPENGIGVTIDCPHCAKQFLLENPEAIYEWMEKQKFPLDRASVIKVSDAKLNGFRLVGIKFVSLLGSGTLADDCKASLALQGKRKRLATAPSLPLPKCDKQFCKCIWLAEA